MLKPVASAVANRLTRPQACRAGDARASAAFAGNVAMVISIREAKSSAYKRNTCGRGDETVSAAFVPVDALRCVAAPMMKLKWRRSG